MNAAISGIFPLMAASSGAYPFVFFSLMMVLQFFVVLFVYPETKGKAPAVLVIHEIFGLSDWARSVADQLAANGYIAIAPDMLSGFGPNGGKSSDFPSVDAAREANSKLDPDTVTADLNAVADYLKKLPSFNGKLAVAGFCWGGGQSFRFDTNRKDLKAASGQRA